MSDFSIRGRRGRLETARCAVPLLSSFLARGGSSRFRTEEYGPLRASSSLRVAVHLSDPRVLCNVRSVEDFSHDFPDA